MDLKHLMQHIIHQFMLLFMVIMMKVTSMIISTFPLTSVYDDRVNNENNAYSVKYQLKPVMEKVHDGRYVQKFQIHVPMDNAKNLTPLLFIPLPNKDTKIIHEGICIEKNKLFISFTTSSPYDDKLFKIPVLISFVNDNDLNNYLNSKTTFELPGIPIHSFMFVDQDNWFSKFRVTDKQTWTYNKNIRYNNINKNFTYIYIPLNIINAGTDYNRLI